MFLVIYQPPTFLCLRYFFILYIFLSGFRVLIEFFKWMYHNFEYMVNTTGPLEVVQVSFSLVTLATKLISTQQKTITTQQIINGDIDNNERFRLPCVVQVSRKNKGLGFTVPMNS